ncbi:glycosyltransferase [Pseudoalteromonas rubra]|uniref:Glycosyltransferase family 4 protein n=1 Tax=Pseudoalteromonas rubra TaxID=43658 RepID=A0A5S3WZ26_9GAMM|nr:glycosyltransferase [Pseudoalteromonas rubra]TMP36626.1 glycosyltransferase family 4 protein [Pseudoalteromonas rubra]
MHVVVLPSWYPEFPGDINGCFFREQAIALNKVVQKVGVLYPQMLGFSALKSGLGRREIEVVNDSGLPTYRYHFTNTVPYFEKIIHRGWLKKGEALFVKYIEEHGMPDILHAHSLFKAGFLAQYLSRKYNIPFVVTEHITAYARDNISGKKITQAKPVIESASACIAVSNEFSTLLNRTFVTNKWQYIPNIVSNDFLLHQINSEKTSKENFHFINVCALLPKKRVDILIKAFAIACKTLNNISLDIGGDGPEATRLQELVTELGLNDRVSLLGSLTRDQVKEKMYEADVFVLSSEYETFGVVVVEALALGKPVIATKCGGPETIVSNEVGTLIEKNSPEAMAEAMIQMYRQYEKFDKYEIRAYCDREFSEHSVVGRLVETYHTAISNK